MAKIRHIAEGQRLEEWFMDSLQEAMTDYVGDFSLEIDSDNTLRLSPVGARTALALANLGGAGTTFGWRYVSATIFGATPGGLGAGWHEVYAVASANNYVVNGSPPPHETDSTTYTFALKLMASGGTPSGTGSEAYWKKIGRFHHDGIRITAVKQLCGLTGTPRVQLGKSIPGGLDSGQMFRLRADSGPSYESVGLVYDALKGKWVSEVIGEVKVNSFGVSTQASYAKIPGSSLVIPNYLFWYQAGARLELQVWARFSPGEGSRTLYFAPQVDGYDPDSSTSSVLLAAADANGVSYVAGASPTAMTKMQDWFQPAFTTSRLSAVVVPYWKTAGGSVATWNIDHAVIRARLVA